MKWLRNLLEYQGKLCAKGSKFEKLYPLHEALDTFVFSTGKVTTRDAHVRDGLDMKRMMSIVVVALIPCILMALYNTGLQANLAIEHLANVPAAKLADDWRISLMQFLGLGFDSKSIVGCFIHGALYFFPVLIVTYAAGGFWEVLFAVIRKHEINEGFLVTGALFPLICPPSIPLWQVALGISFGVIFGKEVFGGTGMNFLNPALVGRVFLFFAYPAQISGSTVWIGGVDGYSSPTMLVTAKDSGLAGLSRIPGGWWDAFIGFIPGSMGETSALCCIIGAVLLLVTQVASWRTMLGVVLGALVMSVFFNYLAPSMQNPAFAVPFHWHAVLGGFAFGTVFMATDPVSSSYTNFGKFLYGCGIGLIVILIRVVNPAYPEGMMLAILFMNMLAPLIDYVIVKQNISLRMAGYAKK